MHKDGQITAEGLREALAYLKKNPSVIKFQDGGGFPPYYAEDFSQGQIDPSAIGANDYLFGSQSMQNPFLLEGNPTYDINPLMGGAQPVDPGEDAYLKYLESQGLTDLAQDYMRSAGIEPGGRGGGPERQPVSLMTGDDEYLEYLQRQGNDRELRRYKESAGITSPTGDDPMIGKRGELLEYDDSLPYFDPVRKGERQARRNENRLDRQERKDIRQFNRQNDQDPQGMFSSDEFRNPEGKELVWRDNDGSLPPDMKGDWYVPSAKEERKEKRREKMQSPEFRAGLYGASMIGHAITDLMGGVRDAFSVAAMNKRNQYVMDWYNRKRKEDEQYYTPVSQTANTNYIGGFSYGEKGGTMGKLPKYLEGGFEEGDGNGDEELNPKQQKAQYGYQIMNQLRGYYKHLDPETQKTIEEDTINFGGKKSYKLSKLYDKTAALDAAEDFTSYRVAGNQFVPEGDYEGTGVSFGEGDEVVIAFRDLGKRGRVPVVVGTGKESMNYVKKYFNPHHASWMSEKQGAGQVIPYYTIMEDDDQGYYDYRQSLQKQAYGGLFKHQGGGNGPIMPDPNMKDAPTVNDLYLQEGQYVEFEHEGKMYKGTVKKNENGKIYI